MEKAGGRNDDGMIMIPNFFNKYNALHSEQIRSRCRDFIPCNNATLKSTVANHNTHPMMINTKPCIVMTQKRHSPPTNHGYCKSYLAILKCEAPKFFLALVGIPAPLPLFRLIPSNFALSCSCIFLFWAHPSASFCIRMAAMTARAADLSLGRRSWTVMSGVMPI